MMIKIVLVEDNEDHALLIRRALTEDGIEILHFLDGTSALAFFKKNPAKEDCPALILLDLKLPDIDGFEILRFIRSHPKYRLLPIVILTTSKRKEEIKRAYEMGADGFVTKAESFSDLLTQMNRVKEYWLRAVERPPIE